MSESRGQIMIDLGDRLLHRDEIACVRFIEPSRGDADYMQRVAFPDLEVTLKDGSSLVINGPR